MRNFIQYIIIILFMTGCTREDDVTGSFEESAASGRLFVGQLDAPKFESYRYFRFHLRQFDNRVSGTFETFDLNSYDAFQQMPVIMDNAMKNAMNVYYCSRIDSGYVRNGSVHIMFTDKEQRSWMYTGSIDEDVIEGKLERISASGSIIPNTAASFLMPEDAAYYQRGDLSKSQMVFEKMEDKGDDSLDCIHYYKNKDLFFIFPDEVMSYCDNKETCGNLRLAIIGTPAVSKTVVTQAPFTIEILSATMSSADITDSTIRINLHDNPHAKQRAMNGLFIATAWIYQDKDYNGQWNTKDPILATLKNQVLLFYDEQTEPQFYGAMPEGYENNKPADKLVIDSNDFKTASYGWHVCDETSIKESTGYWRIPTSIKPVDTAPIMQMVSSPGGCILDYSQSVSEEANRCHGILPLLLL